MVRSPINASPDMVPAPLPHFLSVNREWKPPPLSLWQKQSVVLRIQARRPTSGGRTARNHRTPLEWHTEPIALGSIAASLNDTKKTRCSVYPESPGAPLLPSVSFLCFGEDESPRKDRSVSLGARKREFGPRGRVTTNLSGFEYSHNEAVSPQLEVTEGCSITGGQMVEH